MPITRVRVGAETPNAADVLDYAIALIEEKGWNQKANAGVKSSDTSGYTLHDAIGEACQRLSHATIRSRQKDWTVHDPERGARNLRTEATVLVQNAIAATGVTNTDDRTFNDNANSVADVLDVLKAAREAAV